jgi:hypothetical protein
VDYGGLERPCKGVSIYFGMHQLFLDIRMQCLFLPERCDTTDGIVAAVSSTTFDWITYIPHIDLLLRAWKVRMCGFGMAPHSHRART